MMMVIMMNDSKVNKLAQIKGFLAETEALEFNKRSKKEAYCWIEETLRRFTYVTLSKVEKGLIRSYLMKITGYSRSQLTRHINQYRKTRQVRIKEYDRHKFQKKYTNQDIRLLAKTARLHDSPNGAALKKTLERMAREYGKEEYLNISHISVSHIYNLKKSVSYLRSSSFYQKTYKGKGKIIGVRCKPQPQGKPGYLRVDTMPQGDQDGRKGVYPINTVDEVTQWEVIGATEKITEEYLLPLLEKLIASYPFQIINFHADNGSEYINQKVAEMLNRLLIKFTKSRPRPTEDNALVETKNGWALRKWLGYSHNIRGEDAHQINDFYFGCFSEYLNFHRPCAFPTEAIDHKGKIKKKYDYQDYQTPYEKLRSIADAQKYLKEGITLEMLDKIVQRYTDNGMAKKVQLERDRLFAKIVAA
ncbi:MAG TPA: integrase [Candidatus Atribacteria bacterium]|nr:integrase [Candidatus Atribacteria bacterium]